MRSSKSGWDLAVWWMRYSRLWMRSSQLWMWYSRGVYEIQPRSGWDLAAWWMRSSRVVDEIYPRVDEIYSRVVRGPDTQYRRRNCPGFYPSILRHSHYNAFPVFLSCSPERQLLMWVILKMAETLTSVLGIIAEVVTFPGWAYPPFPVIHLSMRHVLNCCPVTYILTSFIHISLFY